MDTLSLIVVADETSPVRRFELRKSMLKRSAIGAGVFAVLLLAGMVDYVRVRIDNRELASLRAETIERREQVAAFEKRLERVDGWLAKANELERKVRIIANLPGASSSGGDEVTEVGDPETGEGGRGGLEEPLGADLPAGAPSRLPPIPEDADVEQRVERMSQAADFLHSIAEGQNDDFEQLVAALEGKQDRLASSPSIWPAKGWLTSRYGYRTSPFTNRKQFHSGIDVAGALGTPIVAPARGKVTYAGRKGPLGNTVIIDHGYGVRTQYGHNKELLVKRGQRVERGDQIALLGSSGRSTGPHLHYVVEVNGKTRNPLDYIFE